MGDQDIFSFTDNKFTISFWMKANNTTSPIGIIGKRGSPWEYSIYASTGGTLIFNTWPSDGSTYVYPFLTSSYDTNWTNLFLLLMEQWHYLYKNGVLVSSSMKTSANFSNTTSSFEIGRGAMLVD
jgi:hypothetical protein